MKKIVLIGAGGHCKVIIDIIKSTNEYEIAGVTDDMQKQDNVLDIPIIGNDDILGQLYQSGVNYAFICVGALNNINLRNSIYKKLKLIGFKVPVLIHKNSIVSEFVHIGDGTCVMPGAIINAGCQIGINCIINSGCVVEHDCTIGDNSHISPNVSLAGGVNIGCNTHVGIGSSIIQNISLGNNVTIGAGAVVINNIDDNALAVGVPAKIISINNRNKNKA